MSLTRRGVSPAAPREGASRSDRVASNGSERGLMQSSKGGFQGAPACAKAAGEMLSLHIHPRAPRNVTRKASGCRIRGPHEVPPVNAVFSCEGEPDGE